VNPYLLIGLSMAVGFVFGYAVALWRWCGSEEKRDVACAHGSCQKIREAENPAGLRQSVTLTNLPPMPPGATDMPINGRPLSTFYRPPTTFQHPDHTSCSRRRFGSGCVPFQEKSE
jgi:hypothetical protein